MYAINVIVTSENTVQENFLFTGFDEQTVVKAAEEKFLEFARKYQPGLSQEDEESYLDDGYCEDYANVFQVCISHPEIISVIETIGE